MDNYAMLTAPAEVVFGYLADPARLGSWLPQLVRVQHQPASLVGLGSGFTATVRTADGDRDVDAEIVAHEPPWLITYRLLTDTPQLIRATCSAQAGGTRVHVHQTDGAATLAVDLTPLCQALADTDESPIAAPARHP